VNISEVRDEFTDLNIAGQKSARAALHLHGDSYPELWTVRLRGFELLHEADFPEGRRECGLLLRGEESVFLYLHVIPSGGSSSLGR
jgi:hypothetical protein